MDCLGKGYGVELLVKFIEGMDDWWLFLCFDLLLIEYSLLTWKLNWFVVSMSLYISLPNIKSGVCEFRGI
jgi:hypothetical protein